MKIFLIYMFLSLSCHAQSLYNARSNTKVSYRNTEAFYVTFTKSAYGLEFDRNDRALTPELKTKIERFMKNTNRPKYKGLGKITLEIIKRNNYYIVENKKPEKLSLL